MNEFGNTKRVRRASRIFVLDPKARILLFRFDLVDRPPFWVTAGGECEADESFEQAARRELYEETGIHADPGSQVGRTTPEFVTVEGESVQADERYFLVQVDHEQIDTSGHTALEKQVMTQHRWFDLSALASWPEAIYPENLAEMVVAAV